MIGRVVSHYRIVSVLGRGGMGVVYTAEDLHLKRRVAVKFADPEHASERYRARFLQEARAASALNHPNIAAIYDYGEEQGQAFIVMELIQGRNLLVALREGGLSLLRRLQIIQSVLEALVEAHRHGVIHRDIKPGNILIGERGEVKVLDFGLAKLLDEAPAVSQDTGEAGAETATREGVVKGTPQYMSPEQAKGQATDPRSDLFSVGVVLYESLTGRPPFSAASAIEVLGQVLHVDPAPPSSASPGLPPELDRITMKCLAKRPEDRYPSAAELKQDIGSICDRLAHSDSVETQLMPAPAGTLSSRTQITLTVPVSRGRLAVLVAAFVVVGLGAWYFFKPRPHRVSPDVTRYYQEGLNALRDGTYFKASKALERAVALDPAYPLAHARLAEAWAELDYPDKARQEMLRAAPPGKRLNLPRADQLYLEAVNAALVNDNAGAVTRYEEIAKNAPDAEKPDALVDLGRAYERDDKRKQAIEEYLEATRRSPQDAAAHLHLGAAYALGQDAAHATPAFDQAESIYRSLSNLEGVTEVVYQRARAAIRTGQPAEARRYCEQAIALAHTAGDVNQQITAELLLSETYYTMADTGQGQHFAADALELARSNGMESLTTRGLIQLGNVMFRQGDRAKARQYYSQALEYARRFQEQRQEMRALFSLASLSIQEGNLTEGIRELDPALAFFQQGGYRQETSQALILSARARRKQGDYEGALKASTQQLALAQQMGDRAVVVLAEESLGLTLSAMDRFPEALGHFQKEYQAAEAAKNVRSMEYAVFNSGSEYWQLGRFAESRRDLGQALALANGPGGDASLVTQVHLALGRIELSEGRWAAAAAEAAPAVDSRDQSNQIGALRILTEAEARQGKAVNFRMTDRLVDLAEKYGDRTVLAPALWTAAKVHLLRKDPQTAISLGQRAQQEFARAGQAEGEWRTWVVLARAYEAMGDRARARQAAAQGAAGLVKLPGSWPAADYQSYLARPDVQEDQKWLKQLSS